MNRIFFLYFAQFNRKSEVLLWSKTDVWSNSVLIINYLSSLCGVPKRKRTIGGKLRIFA